MAFFVAIDMHGHGERRIVTDNNEGKYDFNNIFKDTYMTSCDIPNIIEHIKANANYKLDLDNIGAVGVSNGANIALISGYRFKEIKYVVSIIGVFNWSYIVENNLFSVFKHYATIPTVIEKQKVQDDINNYEPCNNYTQGNLKPILFLHGQMDTAVPQYTINEYFKRLYSVFDKFGKGDYLKFVRYPNTGHEVTNVMISDLLVWLSERKNTAK